MKKIDSNRTEYQEFLFSLFKRFGIDSPDESWSDKEWKDIVNSRLTNNHNRANFYRELEEFNVKNPSDEIWSYKSDEKLDEIKPKVTKEEEIKPKVNKEDKLKKCPYCAEEIKQEAIICRYCKSVLNNEEEDEIKLCPYCAEEIKDKAMKCPHCHEILIKREPKPEPQSQIIIKAKKNSWYWKNNKVDLYLDGKFASEIGRKEDLKYNVFNGKHKIHLVASVKKRKPRDSSHIDDIVLDRLLSPGKGTDQPRPMRWVNWTKSNKIEIEILNSNLTFDWGMNSFAGIKSEGLWIKQI